MADSEHDTGEVFDIQRIRNLVELMKEHDLSEIDLRQSDQRIRLCRGSATEFPGMGVPISGAMQSAAAAARMVSPGAPSAETPAAASDENIVFIRSPMVGTFYTRPNPNAEPFVKVGDHINPETTVCIIEAMKVFNEIPAETRGRIVAVLVDDEEPVEFGKPLFRVDTSS